jgi:hypothetical protein
VESKPSEPEKEKDKEEVHPKETAVPEDQLKADEPPSSDVKSVDQESGKQKSAVPQVTPTTEESFGDVQRRLREEARANRERQMAALQAAENKLDMDQIVAQAEREQRKKMTLGRSKNLGILGASVVPGETINMDQIVAEAEAELRKKRKSPAPASNNGNGDGDAGKEEVMQQASAILEALNMPNDDASQAREAEREAVDPEAGTFFVGGSELKMPTADDSESAMCRAERIRDFLEKQLGVDRFLSLCRTIANEEAQPEDVDKETMGLDPGILMLLHQLHALDDNSSR